MTAEDNGTTTDSAGLFQLRFRKFSQEAFSPRAVGFAFSRAWVFTAFSASLLAADEPVQLMDTLYIFSLISLVALLVVGGLAERQCERLMASLPGRLLPAGLSILGTTLIPLAGFSHTAGLACLAISAGATGLGSGLFVLFWGRVYSTTGAPVAAAEVSVAFILATLPVPLILLLPPAGLLSIVTLLPIASSLVLFINCYPRMQKEASEEYEGWHLETVGLGFRLVMVKLLGSSLVFGCVVSLMHSLAPTAVPPSPAADSGITLLLSALIAGSITLAVLFFSRRLDLAFTYRPVLIFMSLGCLLFPFLDNFAAIAWTFTMSGYLCFEIMNWVTLCDITYRFNLPPFRVFGFGRAAVSGGVLVGALIAQWLNQNLEFTFQIVTALSFAMVFVMIVTYTFTLTERDVARITRQRARMPQPGNGFNEGPSLDDRLAMLAEEHGIGERGLEILQLLARGRSGTRIEQELYISRGTVNTHMRRLYQKLGVHTRQELLDMIDATDAKNNGEKR
jgi:DNA-binding CsgD family transcriptional regulator